jgi:hypothetical protein
MSSNLKILVPAAVVLSLTLSGATLAGSITEAGDNALYGQPDPFAAVETTAEDAQWASANDQRLQEALQQASTVNTPGFGREQPAPTAHDDLYDPE